MHVLAIVKRSGLQVLSEMVVSGGVVGSPDALIRIYQQLFCLQAYPHTNIVKYNDFSDFSAYLVQKVQHVPHFIPLTLAKENV